MYREWRLSSSDICKDRKLGFRVQAKKMELEKTNNKFNEELQQHIEGSLPKGHIYKLGRPGKILLRRLTPIIKITIHLNCQK